MTEWTKVVTHPLGLAGFALFVVLILLTRRQADSQPAWLKAFFAGMAFIALLGGLWLAYEQTKSPPPAERQTPKGAVEQKPSHEIGQQTQKPPQETSPKSSVNQRTSGRGSPAVGNAGRDVNITITNP